ncbi:MAG: hypothetical protein AAFY99_07390 [Pseudomonadota bacterium]
MVKHVAFARMAVSAVTAIINMARPDRETEMKSRIMAMVRELQIVLA